MIYFYFKPFRKCVYYRCTYSVKSSGYFVSSSAEFSSCMKYSKYNFNCRKSRFVINTDRNTSSVITHCNRIIFVNIYLYFIAISRQSFVYGIIHDLIYKMVKSSRRSAADIHTGPFPYGFQTFQYLDLIRSIFRVKFCT